MTSVLASSSSNAHAHAHSSTSSPPPAAPSHRMASGLSAVNTTASSLGSVQGSLRSLSDQPSSPVRSIGSPGGLFPKFASSTRRVSRGSDRSDSDDSELANSTFGGYASHSISSSASPGQHSSHAASGVSPLPGSARLGLLAQSGAPGSPSPTSPLGISQPLQHSPHGAVSARARLMQSSDSDTIYSTPNTNASGSAHSSAASSPHMTKSPRPPSATHSRQRSAGASSFSKSSSPGHSPLPVTEHRPSPKSGNPPISSKTAASTKPSDPQPLVPKHILYLSASLPDMPSWSRPRSMSVHSATGAFPASLKHSSQQYQVSTPIVGTLGRAETPDASWRLYAASKSPVPASAQLPTSGGDASAGMTSASPSSATSSGMPAQARSPSPALASAALPMYTSSGLFTAPPLLRAARPRTLSSTLGHSSNASTSAVSAKAIIAPTSAAHVTLASASASTAVSVGSPLAKAKFPAMPSRAGSNERLDRLAMSFTVSDLQAYTAVVENSRQAKNYLWKCEPTAFWPAWHDVLQQQQQQQQQPLSDLLESSGHQNQQQSLFDLQQQQQQRQEGYHMVPLPAAHFQGIPLQDRQMLQASQQQQQLYQSPATQPYQMLQTLPGIALTLSPSLVPTNTVITPHRNPSPTRLPPNMRAGMISSPVLTPLPVSILDFRSPSPMFLLDDDDANESDSSITSASARSMNKMESALHGSNIKSRSRRLRGSLHISTSGNPHGQSASPVLQQSRLSSPVKGGMSPPPVSSGSEASWRAPSSTPLNRSLSDGDLTEYLKGFADLKSSLQVAKMTCDAEVQKILKELEEHVERRIRSATSADSRMPTPSTPIDIRSSTTATSSLAYGRTSATSSTSSFHATDHSPLSYSQHSQNSFSTSQSPLQQSFSQSPSQLSQHQNPQLYQQLQQQASLPPIRDRKTLDAWQTQLPPVNASITMPLAQQKPPLPGVGGSASSIVQQAASATSTTNNSRVGSTVGLSASSNAPGMLVTTGTPPSKRSSIIRLADDVKPGVHILTSEDAQETPFSMAIKDLIDAAEGILEMDVTSLMTPGTCRSVIAEIQELQHRWAQHPDWPLTEVVVRLLIVFASVARLLEHLEEDTRMWMYVSGYSGPGPQARIFSGVARGRRPSAALFPLPPRLAVRRESMSSTFSSGTGMDSSDADMEDDGGAESETSREGTPRRMRQPRSRTRTSRPFLQLVSKHEKQQDKWSLSELRAAADEGQSLNVLLEVAYDGLVTYISPVVRAVFGYEPSAVVGASTMPFLPPNERNVFVDACRSCPSEDKATMEIAFVAVRADGRLLRMEAKGMLNLDKTTGRKRSVIWVTRPVGLKGELWEDELYGQDAGSQAAGASGPGAKPALSTATTTTTTPPHDAHGDTAASTATSMYANSSAATGSGRSMSLMGSALHDGQSPYMAEESIATTASPVLPATPGPAMLADPTMQAHDEPIPITDLALCNICERSVPAIIFEEHSDLCTKVHKTEMEVVLANDQLKNYRAQCLEKVGLLEDEIKEERMELAEIITRRKSQEMLATPAGASAPSDATPASPTVPSSMQTDGPVPSDAAHASSSWVPNAGGLSEDNDRRKYLRHLEKLVLLGRNILGVIDETLAIPIPKTDDVQVTGTAEEYDPQTGQLVYRPAFPWADVNSGMRYFACGGCVDAFEVDWLTCGNGGQTPCSRRCWTLQCSRRHSASACRFSRRLATAAAWSLARRRDRCARSSLAGCSTGSVRLNPSSTRPTCPSDPRASRLTPTATRRAPRRAPSP
ncbi:hypothetical protein BC831DRAFT_132702 [Entophlyctis helioformis]|nr:hypothetical protein BC831DRAFT_132702 [Entophlyctis helioformis]